MILSNAGDFPDAPFFLSPEGQRIIRYGELPRHLSGVAHFLADLPPQAVVAVIAENGWACTQLLLAIPYYGRQVLVINLAAGPRGMMHAIAHSECRLIFVQHEYVAQCRGALDELGDDAAVQIVPIDRDIGCPPAQTEIDLPTVTADHDALLIYTSGTTGVPKGVVHTHRSLLAGGHNTAIAHQLTKDDRALCVLPLYHINGQCVTVMAPLVSAGSVVIAHKFSVRYFWQWLHRNECTWFSVVPTIISHLLKEYDDAAPPEISPSLRFGRSASSPLAVDVHQRFERNFGIRLYETMGLSESAAQILANPMPPAQIKYGSPGIAFGNDIKIIDPAGEDAACDVEGEILVRGDNVMRGYLKNEQATREAFTTDGWLRTGDLGRLDKDGFVFVTGRTKELIIKGGENIAPREIDDVLYSIPHVTEAAAFGRDCPTYGQQVEAAVVLSHADACSEQELIDHCVAQLGKFRAPGKIHFLQTLPKGPSGKIQRLKLAQQLNPR